MPPCPLLPLTPPIELDSQIALDLVRQVVAQVDVDDVRSVSRSVCTLYPVGCTATRRRAAHSQRYRTLLPQVGWELRLPAAPEAAPLRAILYAKDAGDDERCERARSCDEI